jgi:phosphodiesterase/alkaline phosphatase D-like protein
VTGNSTVEYGLTQGLGLTATVGGAGSCMIGSAGRCHTVLITLLPGTRYFYQLLTNGAIVQPGRHLLHRGRRRGACPNNIFSSCPSPYDGSQEQAVANHRKAADPPIIITVGDNAYQNGTQSDWDNHALGGPARIRSATTRSTRGTST